jgi:penicillin-binding protein 1C
MIFRQRKKIAFAIVTTVVIITLEQWTQPKDVSEGTVKIYDKNSALIYEYAGSKGYKRKVSIDSLSQNTINAVLSTEDKRFFFHTGFDPLAIARAIKQNIGGNNEMGGASTITQQLARKVYFDGGNMKNSYLRKIRELLVATRLELATSKKRILEKYLNEMYFGNYAYGIESASNVYFDKNSANLTLAEGAFLSAIIASPYKYDPISNFSGVKQRQERILQLMQANGFLTSEEVSQALTEEITVNKTYQLENTESYHFADYIINQVGQQKEIKSNFIDRKKPLNIYTTLDLNKQRDFYKIAKYYLERIGEEHLVTNTAVVIFDNLTGATEVMIGGINYFDQENAGSVNMATALRQPGSAIKPITYALAFKEGYYPSFLIDDEKTMYLTRDGAGFVPENYDNIFHGRVSLRTALASSLNEPAVEMLHRLGTEKFVNTAVDMGIKTYVRGGKYDLSLTLGGGEVTLLDLTNVYATLARGGNYLDYYAIEKIQDEDGNVLYTHNPTPVKKALGDKGQQVSFMVTDILSDTKARMLGFGEKNPLNLTRRTAAKTGTTSNWHDVWTLGYNQTYTVGVWAGNNTNSPMIDISGVTGAAPIWNAIFEKIYQSETYSDFKVPDGLEKKLVCKLTGLPQPCEDTYEDYFLQDWKQISNSAIDAQTDNPLEIVNPKQNAVFKLSNDVVSGQNINFELRALATVQQVTWSVNGRELATTSTKPYSYNFPAMPGKYSIKAVGVSENGITKASNQVDFEVLSY